MIQIILGLYVTVATILFLKYADEIGFMGLTDFIVSVIMCLLWLPVVMFVRPDDR